MWANVHILIDQFAQFMLSIRTRENEQTSLLGFRTFAPVYRDAPSQLTDTIFDNGRNSLSVIVSHNFPKNRDS